jgi:membrane protease YdiL (CAAX protease family)
MSDALLSPEQNTSLVRDYWRESRRPLVSLAFVTPLLVIYEAGILLWPDAMRNGAEVWLRSLLDLLGFGQYFLLPVLTAGMLLGWHHVNRDRWCVPTQVLQGMAGECTFLALCLAVIGYLQGVLLSSILPSVSISWIPPLGNVLTDLVARAIGFFGAGIYEEVLFRLMLLTGLVSLLHLVQVPPRRAVWIAIGISSLLFSLAHYVGPQGDQLRLYSFLFRFVAGAFFAILFVRRGFGIAAGTHAFYDILVGLV